MDELLDRFQRYEDGPDIKQGILTLTELGSEKIINFEDGLSTAIGFLNTKKELKDQYKNDTEKMQQEYDSKRRVLDQEYPELIDANCRATICYDDAYKRDLAPPPSVVVCLYKPIVTKTKIENQQLKIPDFWRFIKRM